MLPKFSCAVQFKLFFCKNAIIMGYNTSLCTCKCYDYCLQEMTITAERAEMDLHHKILRETAELSKAINVRGETIRTFTKYKSRNKEDRRMLDEEKRVRIALWLACKKQAWAKCNLRPL